MSLQNSAESVTDPVQVYCRIRPINNSGDSSCVEVVSSKTINIRPPETTHLRWRPMRDIQYTFQHLFGAHSTQCEVYDRVAQPLIEGLIKGENGLLFTHGVKSSGKTYTTTGILLRCLESLFRIISDYQTKMFIFKPDCMNGYEISSKRQAKSNSRKGKHDQRKESDPNIASQASTESSILAGNVEDNMYAVFVTYIEVYNDAVYDLLEDGPPQKLQQPKMIRCDKKSNMYVHGVTEVEVKTVSKAIETYNLGQKRKRTAHTALNSECSHSVFTIRLVQAPIDSCGEQLIQDRRKITVSQLSLVDLANADRTNSTDVRLRKAGYKNNSLKILRACLEMLRENQNSTVHMMVPCREAKITHLFKRYFDGEGQVRMIVCINPRKEDFVETTQVMKFAEMIQVVQAARPTPMKYDIEYTPGAISPDIDENKNIRWKQSLYQGIQKRATTVDEFKARELEWDREKRERDATIKDLQTLIESLEKKCEKFEKSLKTLLGTIHKITGDVPVNNRSRNPVPLGTIFQPNHQIPCESVTNLVDAKDLVKAKSSKHCWISQGADTDDEVETHLYKGNAIPTWSGDAQAVFNDIESIKQRSAVTSSPSTDELSAVLDLDEFTPRRSVRIQGKKKKHK